MKIHLPQQSSEIPDDAIDGRTHDKKKDRSKGFELHAVVGVQPGK